MHTCMYNVKNSILVGWVECIKLDHLNVHNQPIHTLDDIVDPIRIPSNCLQFRSKDVVEFLDRLCQKRRVLLHNMCIYLSYLSHQEDITAYLSEMVGLIKKDLAIEFPASIAPRLLNPLPHLQV